jgi:hypothetical protein
MDEEKPDNSEVLASTLNHNHVDQNIVQNVAKEEDRE